MSATRTKIPDDVIPVLRRSVFEGNTLTLPDKLDRATYLRVAAVLKAARGKWNTRAKTHVFPFDPRELIGEAIESGTVLDARKALQFFETPNALAQRMVDLARLEPGQTALEPSAGLGRLVRPMLATGAAVVAVEIDQVNAAALLRSGEGSLDGRIPPAKLTVHREGFETFHLREAALFDAVVMNPPFAAYTDVVHITAAWAFVRPGGRLVALCSEGPFFRQDHSAVAFREWLDSIGAEITKPPPRSFHESGTDVACRLIFATRAGQPKATPRPDTSLSCYQATCLPGDAPRDIPMDQIEPDPDQPRKTFEPVALREFAASIQVDGLLQPISVRAIGPERFRIIFGERRWRAHQINRAATIRAFVTDPISTSDTRVKQIIENDQREDITPLEQARAYQDLMAAEGWTVEQLAARINKAPHRITERTNLLTLRPEYQHLLASGNLQPSQATELTRLSPRGQTVLFDAIRTGQCRTYGDLRASATALVQAEAQLTLMPDAPPPPTKEDRELATAFEASMDRIAALLRSGIHDNQVVAVRKTNPHRAAQLADLLGVMQKDIRRVEIALREAAVQASFLAAA